MPRNKFGFTGLRDIVGKYVPESLPNIRGTGFGRNNSENPSGACTPRATAYSNFGSISGYISDFNASLSSSTYQDDAPVQQKAIQVYLEFYIN